MQFGNTPIKINEAGKWDALPEDRYQVQVEDVEMVLSMNSYKGVEEERLKYLFIVLDSEKKLVGADGVEQPVRGRKLWARFSKNLSLKDGKLATTGQISNLTKFLNAVYGRQLEKAEVEVWEADDVIKKQVCVMVDQKPDDSGNVWNNILSFSSAKVQMEPVVEVEKKKEAVKKSAPAIVDSGEDFEKDMDEAVKAGSKA